MNKYNKKDGIVDGINIHVGEISDIIGKPSKMLVWFSILLICMISAGSVLGSLCIKCPQSIVTNIEISSSVSAMGIISETAGWVESILVADGEKVNQGDTVAILHSGNLDYYIKSPIGGTLSYVGPLSKYQYVVQGTLIGYILPDEVGDISGWGVVSEGDLYHVHMGDRCIVNLERYPGEDFGNLEGYVASVGGIPIMEDKYIVKIEFPNGLTTNIGKPIEYQSKLRGTMSVIVKERKVIDIVLQPIGQFLENI